MVNDYYCSGIQGDDGFMRPELICLVWVIELEIGR